MIGMAAQSGKFSYYVCSEARRKGKEACVAPILRKETVEHFVIDRIKQHILTEENLENIVRLSNERLAESCSGERERVKLVETQLAEVNTRLAKLYDVLETGELKTTDVAPRIKVLLQKKQDLEAAKAQAGEKMRQHALELGKPETVRAYASDLRRLLDESSIIHQKTFLRSFVKSVGVKGSEVEIVYKIPIPPSSPDGGNGVEILPAIQNGSPDRIRTCDLSVNSRPLYR